MGTPRDAKRLADYLEENLFASPLRTALVQDMRGGLFASDECVNPKNTLMLMLQLLKAPPAVIDHVETYKFREELPAPSAELLAAAAAACAAETDHEVDVAALAQADTEDATEVAHAMNDLLLPDCAFTQCWAEQRERERNERAKRHQPTA